MNPPNEFIARLDALVTRLEALLPEPAQPLDWNSSQAFRWRKDRHRGALVAVAHTATVRLADLLCIDRQKAQITRNTRQFLQGLPVNHVLLWGPRGTGKSSLIKALLNEYASVGLRLVEVDKDHLSDLPDIVDQLQIRPERFILYCDDLSFEHHDVSYKALKVVIDGSICRTSDNVLIYATSNRRHLLAEPASDNLTTRLVDTELHHGESVEERLSLSERFGIWLAFQPFSQDEYLCIVSHWLQQFDATRRELDADTVLAARQWSLLHGSRSGRSAWQFARDWAGAHGLAP
jgi:uncharacterized protein